MLANYIGSLRFIETFLEVAVQKHGLRFQPTEIAIENLSIKARNPPVSSSPKLTTDLDSIEKQNTARKVEDNFFCLSACYPMGCKAVLANQIAKSGLLKF